MALRSATGRSLVIGLLASLCVVGGSPRASAEPTWLPTVDATPAISGRYDVAHLPDDTTALVWDQQDDEGNTNVYYATRAPGEVHFSSGEPLSGPGAWDPELVVDEQGAVTVAWLSSDATVQATRLEPGATQWTSPRTVTRPGAQGVHLVVSPNGTVTVVSEQSVYDVELALELSSVDARTLAPGGSWSAPQVVAAETPGYITDLRAAVDGAGAVTAVWVQNDDRVRLASNQGGGGYVEVPVVDDDTALSRKPDVAATPSGGVVVSWAQSAPSGGEEVVVATRAAGGSFTEPVPVADLHEVQAVYGTEVVVDPAGTTTVFFSTQTGPSPDAVFTMIAATRPVGGRFSSQALAVDTFELDDVHVAVASDGAVTAAWWRGFYPDHISSVQAVHRAAGGRFGAIADLAPDDPSTEEDDAGNAPAVTVDADGDATVVWVTYGGPHDPRLRSRVLDTAGPRLRDLSVPAAATSGTAVAMSVSAVDAWSEPSAVAWSFGDGATSTAATTSHTYAAPGTYQVTATAVDGVGNTSSRTRAINVGASVAPPLARDRIAPALSRARVKPKTLPVDAKATLRVTSTEPAALVAVVQRKTAHGWKRAVRKRSAVERGANTEKLFGKAAQLRLKPGKYRVRLVATDAAGNASATTTAAFRVDP